MLAAGLPIRACPARAGSAGRRGPQVLPGGLGEWRGTPTRGRWKLYCTLPGHAKLGMRAVITVR